MALVIAETAAGMFSYHLREVVDGRKYFGGGAPPALCGAPIGWDTRFPLGAWGQADHIPSRWCARCTTAACGTPTPETKAGG